MNRSDPRDRRKKLVIKCFLKSPLGRKFCDSTKKGKLSPRFIGSYEILKRNGRIAYHLALPSELERMHNADCGKAISLYTVESRILLSPLESLVVDCVLRVLEFREE
ncbi:retrotransposon protein [Gossypium australe]|uniref:Retrotransposon protein n=1 Tax=Gossypium australe TaxID=47621 RepID=A0A5B6WHI4_9ROSI|nr:retrotransposon protein [Gossypium australe]